MRGGSLLAADETGAGLVLSLTSSLASSVEVGEGLAVGGEGLALGNNIRGSTTEASGEELELAVLASGKRSGGAGGITVTGSSSGRSSSSGGSSSSLAGCVLDELGELSRGLAVGGDLEVDTVIKGTVLGNGDEDGLMVGSGVDGGHAVDALGETAVDISREDTVLGGGVETPREESL